MKNRFIKIKRVLLFIIIILILISTIMTPFQNNYVYAATVAMSYETLAYISPFLLIGCGMIYDDIKQFNSDIMSLTEHLYQYALRESEWYPGKTQAFEWKLIINENYKQEPDPEKPEEPKKYYIPIHTALFEIAKAWIVAHLASLYDDGVSEPASDLIPIQDFSNVELGIYDYDIAEPCITFYSPDGSIIGEYSEDDFATWPMTIKCYEPGVFSVSGGGFAIPFDPDTYEKLWFINDLELQWLDDKYFTFIDGPGSVLNLGPQYPHSYYNTFVNPWISASQIAYYKIGNYYTEMTNYNAVELNEGMIPGIIDTPLEYTSNGPDEYLYIPVDPDLVVDGNILVDPESLFYDVDDINNLIDSDYTDIQNIVVPDIAGIPTDFDPRYTPDDNTGTNPDPGTDPGPGTDPDPEEPIPEPVGSVGEWILNIPILGDILKALLNILKFIFTIPRLIIDGLKELFIPTSSLQDTVLPLLQSKLNVTIDFRTNFNDEFITLNIPFPGGYIQKVELNNSYFKYFRNFFAAFVYLLFAWLLYKKIMGVFGNDS